MQHIVGVFVRRRVHVPALEEQPATVPRVRRGGARHMARHDGRLRRHAHLLRHHLLHGRMHPRRLGARPRRRPAPRAGGGAPASRRLPRAAGPGGRNRHPRDRPRPRGALRHAVALLARAPGPALLLGRLLSPCSPTSRSILPGQPWGRGGRVGAIPSGRDERVSRPSTSSEGTPWQSTSRTSPSSSAPARSSLRSRPQGRP